MTEIGKRLIAAAIGFLGALATALSAMPEAQVGDIALLTWILALIPALVGYYNPKSVKALNEQPPSVP